MYGKIKVYNRERGFGFISRPGDEDVFLHIREAAITNSDELRAGVPVAFEMGVKRGRPCAIGVALDDGTSNFRNSG